MVTVPVKLLNEEARTPQFQKEGDVCADLYASQNITIPPQETKLVPTGISIELPFGYEAQIRPRSGLSYKHSLLVVNSPGTIDTGYRGEIKIIMKNLGESNFSINRGDRIAQMAIRPVPSITFIEVDELGLSERGADGFGSTGISAD